MAEKVESKSKNQEFSNQDVEYAATQSSGILIEKGKKVSPPPFTPWGLVYGILMGMSIYWMVIPMLFLDICLVWYQNTYFRVMSIPKIPRSEFVKITRWKLPKLSLWQRINCIYCDYGNGLMAWAKEVVAQTETYSCAIKTGSETSHFSHRKNFFPIELFR